MPSATVQKTITSPIEGEAAIAEPKKPLTKAALKGRVPKGLDITVSTPRGEMVLLDVWLSYKNEPTLEIRNVLMEHYLQLVRYTAERVHTKLPSEVDVDDLYSAGLFGLMQAIDAYDLERGFNSKHIAPNECVERSTTNYVQWIGSQGLYDLEVPR